MLPHHYYLSERIIYKFQRTFPLFHLFHIWHFVGRLNIDTLTALVTDKIYFKCHTLLLPCFIPYAMKDIANIDNPYTHTHLIVDDIYLNQLSQCHARHTRERYGPFPPGRTPISLFFISSCHHRPEEGMGKWGESKFRIDTKIAHFPCIMAKNSQARSMTIAFMLILC